MMIGMLLARRLEMLFAERRRGAADAAILREVRTRAFGPVSQR